MTYFIDVLDPEVGPLGPPAGRDSYRQAILGGDDELLATAFAEDAVLWVPLRATPVEGRKAILRYLDKLGRVFVRRKDLRLAHELDSKDHKALVFEVTLARVPSKGFEKDVPYQATDLLEFDEHDRITRMITMSRTREAFSLLQEGHGIR